MTTWFLPYPITTEVRSLFEVVDNENSSNQTSRIPMMRILRKMVR